MTDLRTAAKDLAKSFNLIQLGKELVEAGKRFNQTASFDWEKAVAKGAGLAYDVRKGNIDFKHLTNDEFQREYGNYQDFISKEQLENKSKGSIVL